MDYSYREHLKGWVHLIDPLIEKMEQINAAFPGLNVRPAQIKEKFGTLRFYTSHDYLVVEDQAPELGEALSELYSMIDAAENASEKTCQDCARPGQHRNVAGWYVMLCDEHFVKRLEHRKLQDRGVYKEYQP